MKVVAGKFPYFIKTRSLFSGKRRGILLVGVVMNVIDFPLCLRNCVGKLFSSFCCKH
jgi:hypothetical protein